MTSRPPHARTASPRGRRVAAVVLSGVLVVGGLVTSPGTAQTAAATVIGTASVPSTVSLPRAARADATIHDWKTASPGVIAQVAPEVGSVKSGSIALSIDAPRVSGTRSAAWARVELVPGQTYAFEAHVRVMSKTRMKVGAYFAIGNKAIAIPKLNAAWQKVTGTYTAREGETSTNVAVRVTRTLRGLSVDSVRLSAVSGDTAGQNVVPNSSFENVDVDRGIVSSSLVVTTPTAAAAVALPQGKTYWAIYQSGKRLLRKSLNVKGQISALSITGVPQGLYTLKVVASDKKVVQTSIAIIDSPTPWIAQDNRFGVGLHVEYQSTYANAGRYASALGISDARNDVRWSTVEGRKGAYDFSVYDAPFRELRAYGMNILGIARAGNSLYGASNASAPTTATAIAAYGKYAAAVAKRYELVGLEVFNEFNWPDFNKSKCRTSTCYLKLVKSVHSAVSKVDSKLPIIVGATAKYPSGWFDNLWKQGAIAYTDAMSFHPYEITGHPDDIAGIVKRARSSMKTHGGEIKPVWITELGTSAATGNRTTTQQATVLLRASVTALASGARKFYWYDLINDGPSAAEHHHNFGLYAYPKRGVSAVAPKRAGFIQALTIAQLGGRTFRSSENLGSGIVSHGFGTASNLVRVVWTPSGTKAAKIRTTKPVVLVKFDGSTKTVKPKNGVVTFAATNYPVFVRSGSATAGVTK